MNYLHEYTPLQKITKEMQTKNHKLVLLRKQLVVNKCVFDWVLIYMGTHRWKQKQGQKAAMSQQLSLGRWCWTGMRGRRPSVSREGINWRYTLAQQQLKGTPCLGSVELVFKKAFVTVCSRLLWLERCFKSRIQWSTQIWLEIAWLSFYFTK